MFRQVLQVECIITGLRLTQSKVHRTHLQNIMRMAGRKAQCLPAVYDILAKPQGDIGNAVFRLFISNRVEIQRTRDTGNRRIEMIIVPVSYHLL